MIAKHQFRNSVVTNTSSAKVLNLLHINKFDISTSKCPIHYPLTGNGDMLDIVVHKNFWLSEVIVSDILDSDHLPITFHLLDHVRARNLSDPVDKFTDWERFQSLASDLISSKIQMNSEEEAD
jgi:hypothetical protein